MAAAQHYGTAGIPLKPTPEAQATCLSNVVAWYKDLSEGT